MRVKVVRFENRDIEKTLNKELAKLHEFYINEVRLDETVGKAIIFYSERSEA